jgi:FkbM family methyltransferase
MLRLQQAFRALIERTFAIRMYRTLPRGIDLFADMARLLPRVIPQTIIDVGANRGLWAREARRRFPEARLYCFEPAPDTFLQLQYAYSNTSHVQCINSAVGDAEGEVVLQVEKQCDMSRVVAPSSLQTGEKLVRVPVTTLDSFAAASSISAINILKIDAEGYDLRVLLGSTRLLRSGVPEVIYVEAGFLDPPDVQVPFFAIHTELKKYGYSLFGFYEQVHEWKTSSPRLRRVNAAYINPRLTLTLGSG